MPGAGWMAHGMTGRRRDDRAWPHTPSYAASPSFGAPSLQSVRRQSPATAQLCSQNARSTCRRAELECVAITRSSRARTAEIRVSKGFRDAA